MLLEFETLLRNGKNIFFVAFIQDKNRPLRSVFCFGGENANPALAAGEYLGLPATRLCSCLLKEKQTSELHALLFARSIPKIPPERVNNCLPNYSLHFKTVKYV